jgi:hypothetical protein
VQKLKIMKHLLFLLFFISTVSYAAQNEPTDKRLLSKYSKEELKKMEKETPEDFNYLNYYIANCYMIMDLPAEKSNAHEIKGTIQLKTMDMVNIYDLNLTPKDKDYQYFKIEGTTKMLVILSNEQIKASYQKSKN